MLVAVFLDGRARADFKALAIRCEVASRWLGLVWQRLGLAIAATLLIILEAELRRELVPFSLIIRLLALILGIVFFVFLLGQRGFVLRDDLYGELIIGSLRLRRLAVATHHAVRLLVPLHDD